MFTNPFIQTAILFALIIVTGTFFAWVNDRVERWWMKRKTWQKRISEGKRLVQFGVGHKVLQARTQFAIKPLGQAENFATSKTQGVRMVSTSANVLPSRKSVAVKLELLPPSAQAQVVLKDKLPNRSGDSTDFPRAA